MLKTRKISTGAAPFRGILSDPESRINIRYFTVSSYKCYFEKDFPKVPESLMCKYY